MIEGISKVAIHETHQVAVALFDSLPDGKTLACIRGIGKETELSVIRSSYVLIEHLCGPIARSVIDKNKSVRRVAEGKLVDSAEHPLNDACFIVSRQNNRNLGQARPFLAIPENRTPFMLADAPWHWRPTQAQHPLTLADTTQSYCDQFSIANSRFFCHSLCRVFASLRVSLFGLLEALSSGRGIRESLCLKDGLRSL